MQGPWLANGANNFLLSYLNKDSYVLEFGMGLSTIWFANNVKKIVSIEHNKNWFSKISYALSKCDNVELILHETNVVPGTDLIEDCYSVEIEKFPDEFFDLVLVDGRNRVNCFKKADRVLKTGGYMMLDNSERGCYSELFSFYRGKERFDAIQNPMWKTSWWRK